MWRDCDLDVPRLFNETAAPADVTFGLFRVVAGGGQPHAEAVAAHLDALLFVAPYLAVRR